MIRFSRSGFRFVAALAAIAFGVRQPARACQICLPLPKQSIADVLLACDGAVLAREDPERQFHYRTTMVLIGVAPRAPLDLFVDSATRRLLAADPEKAVLLANDGEWRRRALVDAALRPIVREIVNHRADWRHDEEARLAYFVPLLDHEHPDVRELAHLEVARAPYGSIRRLGNAVPRERILAGLVDARHAEWRALHILLLAQAGDASDKQRIRDAVATGPTLHRAAWATAFVEIDGADAIEYLEGHSRDASAAREVIAALSVHGTSGRTELRDRIVAAYAMLLERHPELATAVVGDLFAWRRWEMADAVRRAAEAAGRSLPPGDVARLRWFAAMADKANGTPSR